jgi:hypothetical protein
MREYAMTSKSGEVIYKIKSDNILEAVKHFALIKQIDAKKLLELFEIKEINKI